MTITARLLKRFPAQYILLMMCFSGVFAFLISFLCVVYVDITFHVALYNQRHFDLIATGVIVPGVAFTVILAHLETRRLRRVLVLLHQGKPLELSLAVAAGREAVVFPGRHALHEAIVDPLITIVPLCLGLWYVDDAPLKVSLQITLAGIMGLSAIIMTTFFVSEYWLRPVVQHLLDEGIPIAYTQLPEAKLQWRMTICFGLAIAVTGLMIGALANQRAMDIIDHPERQAEAMASLSKHTFFITLFAIGLGLFLARLLSNSIASRVQVMRRAMHRVQQGRLDQRLRPTGNDELDILARQFDVMVEQLDQNDQTIRELNTDLEKKVRHRTRQLSKSRRTIKRSLDKLTEHDRLKTEFFSNVSHELRTPLTMIIAPVDRLIESTKSLPSEASRMLEMVRINGYRLLDLINRLLDFSKLEAGQMRLRLDRCDLNQLVDKLIMAATPLAQERGITLETDCDPDLGAFGADEEKVDTIISNLISNAIKFTPRGGTIRVETHQADDRVWVSITDSGIGIDPSQCQRIFERFVQVDGSSSREFSGTGLGLSLVKGLVELHGGAIYVQSQLGKGSRFWFDLPLRAAPEAALIAGPTDAKKIAKPFADLVTYVDATSEPSAPTAPADNTIAHAPTILVVDDTNEVRGLLGEILREHYQVLFARDGQEGLEIAEKQHPHLILSDVMMPRMDGQEFCRRIKQNPATAHIPFVMLTAKTELAMKIGGLDLGADDYLAKPFDQRELLARVRSLLKLRGLHRDLDHRNRELTRAYDELRDLQSQLVQAEKMSSLGQLTAGLAHEINNSTNAVYNGIKPLSASMKRLEGLLANLLARDELKGEEPVRSEVETLFRKVFSLARVVETGASRTARIIGDLRTFSHPGNEAFQSFDLHESLDMCLNLLSNTIVNRITVHRDYLASGEIYGPSGQLNQVFMNIFNNAQQAMEGEGEIFVSTRDEGAAVCVRIRDTGPGIPEAIRARLFDPFFTTKAPGEGTGLGLALSYGLISKLGGSIECKSTFGEGAEFVVRFPREAEEPDEQAARQELEAFEIEATV
ncbi:MAG TPA: ATP-binding protein [Pirellulales bacterium]|jgi:signal transduction histidine kinase|nr:ATP-binding protein [Pirellulales bacterium]